MALLARLLSVVRRSLKKLANWVTGRSEIHRIVTCQRLHNNDSAATSSSAYYSRPIASAINPTATLTTTYYVQNSLLRSRCIPNNLKGCSVACLDVAFDFRDATLHIAEAKLRQATQPAVLRLMSCLGTLSARGAVVEAASTLRVSQFDHADHMHVKLLDTLWVLLMPEVTRNGGAITSEWGEVGFQGKDPATDFRGMGMLGLEQLVFFAAERGVTARYVLKESRHHRRYFPFAATGINITSYVCKLLTDGKLDAMLLSHMEDVLWKGCHGEGGGGGGGATVKNIGGNINGNSHPYSHAYGDASNGNGIGALEAGSEKAHAEAVRMGINVFHGVFCDVYQLFCTVWVELDPPNVLAFPTAFIETQRRFEMAHSLISLHERSRGLQIFWR